MLDSQEALELQETKDLKGRSDLLDKMEQPVILDSQVSQVHLDHRGKQEVRVQLDQMVNQVLLDRLDSQEIKVKLDRMVNKGLQGLQDLLVSLATKASLEQQVHLV